MQAVIPLVGLVGADGEAVLGDRRQPTAHIFLDRLPPDRDRQAPLLIREQRLQLRRYLPLGLAEDGFPPPLTVDVAEVDHAAPTSIRSLVDAPFALDPAPCHRHHRLVITLNPAPLQTLESSDMVRTRFLRHA